MKRKILKHIIIIICTIIIVTIICGNALNIIKFVHDEIFTPEKILLFVTAQTSTSADGISSSPNTIINIATLFRFFM